MNFKKIITAIVLSLVIFLAPTTFKSVKAEGLTFDEHVEVLSSGFVAVVDFYNQGGNIDDSNVNALYDVAGSAVLSAEAIKPQVTTEEYDRKYRDMYTDVFRVFKNTAIYKIQLIYDLSKDKFSPTKGGINAVNNQLKEAKNLIQTATTYQVVVDAEQSFYEFIESDEPSRNIISISTGSDQPITVNLLSSNAIFAEDDKIVTEFFIDSAIIKNTKVALIEHEQLLDPTSGVASYFSIRWVRDEVVLDVKSVDVAPTIFAIEVDDLGVELNEDSCIQIVRYVGNRQVEFIDGVYYNEGYIFFTLSEHLDSAYELDFAVVAKGYALGYSSTLEEFVSEKGILTPFETIADSLMGMELFSGYEKQQIVNFLLGATGLIGVPLVLALLYFLFRIIVRGIRFARRERYIEFKSNYRKLKKENRKTKKKNKILQKEHRAYNKYKENLEKEKRLEKKKKRLEKKQVRIEMRKKRLEEIERRKNINTEEN